MTIPKNKRGQIVTNTVMGIGGLIIGVIVILVILQTIFNANLFSEGKVSTTYLNESKTINSTALIRLVGDSFLNPSCSIIQVVNRTGNSTTVAIVLTSGNYTLGGTGNCQIRATGGDLVYNNSIWNISYTTNHAGDAEYSVDNMNKNFTSGLGNVSSKLPTILLIVAVVFLFGALVLLVQRAKNMGVGQGTL